MCTCGSQLRQVIRDDSPDVGATQLAALLYILKLAGDTRAVSRTDPRGTILCECSGTSSTLSTGGLIASRRSPAYSRGALRVDVAHQVFSYR